MNKAALTKLFSSFAELERAIVVAKASLTRRENQDSELVRRVVSYEEILTKQKSLAHDLCQYAADSNWQEVERHIKLINSLSTMLRDDAREIVQGLKPVFTVEERECLFS